MAKSPSNDSHRSENESSSKGSLGFLLRYYRPYAVPMSIALLFMLPSSGISLFFPALTGNLVDGVLETNNTSQLYNIGLTFLGLLAVQAIVGYFVSITMARSTERAIGSLRSDLFQHIVRLPMHELSQHRVGELSSRMSADITQVQETFSFSIIQLLRQAVFLVGSIIIIVTKSIELTVPILIGMPVIVAIAVLLGRRIRKMSTQTQDALARTSTIVEETLQSIAAVKSYVREGFEIRRYDDALSENVRLAIRGSRLRALFVTFIIFTIFGGVAAVILYGAGLVASGSIKIGDLLAFLMYAMFVGGALGSFAEQFGQVQKSLGASVRMRELLETPIEHLGEAETPLPLTSIELRDVHFAYKERQEANVLDGITLSIASGERVALVGASGAGKSTTAALIQRMYEPTSGELLYNGIPAQELSLAQVRSNIGLVPQDIVLFGGTIEDNIRYGDLDASKEAVIEASRSANALDFIESFSDGFATTVGERGIKLSGGQRQRIAIARALLKNPPILILDEATSSLDATSENLIQEALERLMKDRTTIIIAHRLSTVRSCDRIFVFNEGKIEEAGSHEELLRNESGLYKRWCDLQFINA
ncbi:MAG: ABC transporter ATP-binding protein [bacterium]|nr:ABC transporter ATP-binding protein [bacterium]